jgi:hypothetical protein
MNSELKRKYRDHSSPKIVGFIIVFSIMILATLGLFENYSDGDTPRKFDMDDIIFNSDSAFTLDGKPVTGTIINNFLVTGETFTEENFVNGVRNGKTIIYYPNGK